jgi:parallel beta-helix repeat protein
MNGTTGVFTWTPTVTQAGSYPVTVTVSDGALTDTEGVTITVVNVNQPPVLSPIGPQTVNEGQPLTLSVSATDPDGDALIYTASPLPTGATFTSQTLSWTPTVTQAGSYPVTFSVSDGTLTDSESVTITVVNVNQPPVLSPVGNQTVNEGQLLSVTVSATDPDGDPLTYSASPLPSGATLNPVSGAFAWTPTFTQAGSYPLTVMVNDGDLTDTELVTITVVNVNRPPVLAPIGSQTVNEGQLLSVTVSATDPEGDPLTYTASPLPSGATFTGQTFSWTPTSTQAGTFLLTVTVSDGSLTDDETVSITVVDGSPQTVFHVNNQAACADTNPGTPQQPLCTIGRAVALAVAGDTITVHTGTYREGVKITKSNLTIQGAPGETPPTIKGSDIVAGWTKNSTTNTWTRVGPVPLGAVYPELDPFGGGAVCSHDRPLCRFPYQVFMDGQPQTLVGITTAVTPKLGEFVYIPAQFVNHQLVPGTNVWRLGTEPTGKTVEVSIRTRWIEGDGVANRVTVRGLQFRHSSGARTDAMTDGPRRPDNGRNLGQGWVFENNDIGFAGSKGLSIGGDYAVVRNNQIHDNGQMGLTSGDSGYGIAENNTFYRNNLGGWNNAWEAGAAKLVAVHDWKLLNNTVHDNPTYGLLCDILCKDVLFEGNRVYNNLGFGIMYEISTGCTIKDNIVYDNFGGSGAGIQLYSANNCTVEGNIVVRTRNSPNMLLLQDNGRLPYTINNVIRNNTVIGGTTTNALIAITDNDPTMDITTQNNSDQNKVYHVSPLPPEASWYRWGGTYNSPAALCAAQNQECNSTVLTAAQVQQILAANGIPLNPPGNGDLNGDDRITLADLRLLVQMLTGRLTPTAAADLTGDGQVSLADAQELVRILTSS